jgi:DNA-binding CsgD family transcriptional regulator
LVAIDDRTRAALLELIEAAVAATSEEERINLLIDGFRAVLHGEVGGFNHVDVVRGRAVVVMRPQPPGLPDPSGSVQRTLEKHPVIKEYRRNPAPVPLVLSKCPMGGCRRWEDHPTYKEVFGPMGTPHLITVPLPWDTGIFQIGAGFAVTRSGRDFKQPELHIARVAAQLLRVLTNAGAAPGPTARLDLLTTAERRVLARYGYGLRPTEIAEILGRSPETIRAQLRAASATLQLRGGPGRQEEVARILGHLPPRPLPADELRRIIIKGRSAPP